MTMARPKKQTPEQPKPSKVLPLNATAAQAMDSGAIFKMVADMAFSNVSARIGYGTNNLLEGTTYENVRLTRDFMLLLTLYRSNWLARKVIDLVAEDMCKNWYQIISGMKPEGIDQLQKLERTTKTRASILQALKWGRLFGGGACIMIIDGHEDRLDEPLDLAEVMPGSYKGLIPLDRWSGIQPGAQLIDDIGSPDFGLPASYTVTLSQGGNFNIHASRVLRFIGRDLPNWEKQAEMYWGVSEIEIIFDELKKRDNTSWNIAGLIFLANIRVLTLPQLGDVLGMGTQQSQTKLYNVLRAQADLMSNMGMMVLPQDGTFDMKQYSFSGLNEIYESFMLDMSGACYIPVTKLFGRAPAGMNATGESDNQNYYDYIGQLCESQLRPVFEKLLPVQCTSIWGQVPSDLDFKFPSAQTVPMEKMGEIAGKFVSSIVEAYQSDLITKRAGAKELRQLEDATGLFSNVTDEDIAAATNEYQSESGMGEMGGGAGMPGGGEQPGQPETGQKPNPEGKLAEKGLTQGHRPDLKPRLPNAPSVKEELKDAAPSGSRVMGLIAELKTVLRDVREGKPIDTSAIRQGLEEARSGNSHLQTKNTTDHLLGELKQMVRDVSFEESKHPRGQPENAGQFAESGGVSSKSEKSKTTSGQISQSKGNLKDTKIVDDEGKPAVLYRGYTGTGDLSARKGPIFLAADEEIAKEYGPKTKRFYAIIKKPLEIADISDYPEELDISKFQEDAGPWEPIRPYDISQDQVKKNINILRSLGYDGIILSNDDIGGIFHKTIVVFDPSQLVSTDPSIPSEGGGSTGGGDLDKETKEPPSEKSLSSSYTAPESEKDLAELTDA